MASGNKKIVRRVKANSSSSSKTNTSVEKKTSKKVVTKVVKTNKGKAVSKNDNTQSKPIKKVVAKDKKAGANHKIARNLSKIFDNKIVAILLVPFRATGRYIKNSYKELRQVQWPNRNETWKMTVGVIAFCIFIGLIIVVVDWASQWVIRDLVMGVKK